MNTKLTMKLTEMDKCGLVNKLIDKDVECFLRYVDNPLLSNPSYIYDGFYNKIDVSKEYSGIIDGYSLQVINFNYDNKHVDIYFTDYGILINVDVDFFIAMLRTIDENEYFLRKLEI